MCHNINPVIKTISSASPLVDGFMANRKWVSGYLFIERLKEFPLNNKAIKLKN